MFPNDGKQNKTITLGSMQISTSTDGEAYEIITVEQLKKMPFWPRTRGAPGLERCMFAVWDVFEDTEGSRLANYVNGWIMLLIISSAIIAVIETIPDIHKSQETTWNNLEHFFVANFTLEFLCRLISCPSQKLFWTTGMNYVDVIAIIPYWVDVIYQLITSDSSSLDISFLRILRLGRAFRLVKLGRYSQGVRLVTNAMSASLDALKLFLLVLVLVVVVFSSAIYYTERGEWNEYQELYYRRDPNTGEMETHPSTFQSIPASFWWSITTLTTVGYGDMYPFTTEGKIMGTCTILVGLVMLALPLSILGTNFVEERMKMVAAGGAEHLANTKLEPLNLITELDKLLEDTKSLNGMVEQLQEKAASARAAMNELNQCAEEQDAGSLEEPERYKPVLDKTVAVPVEKVEQFKEACAQLLVVALQLKDCWDPTGNGLESLPPYVSDLVLPYVGDQLQRQYIMRGEDKLYFGKLDVAVEGESGVLGSPQQTPQEIQPSQKVEEEPNPILNS